MKNSPPASADPITLSGYIRERLFELILQTRLRARAVRLSADPEAVHNFRVSLRRLRAALRAMRLHRDDFYLRYFEKSLKAIADRTTDLRDFEVLLETVDGLDLDEATRAGITPFLERYRNLEREGRARFKESLEQPEALWPLKQLRAFLLLPERPAELPTPARVAIKAVNRVLRPVRKKLKMIRKRRTNTPWLHRLRIDCKRLRYTVDFYQGLLPLGYATLSKTARSLQNHLGDIHDCDFILEHLAVDSTLTPEYHERLRESLQKRRAGILKTTVKKSDEQTRVLSIFT